MTTATAFDWSIIESDIVDGIIRTEARGIARKFAGVIEEDDLRQEAYILCAGNAATVRGYLVNSDTGYLAIWLRGRLFNIAEHYSFTSNREVALEFGDE